MRQNSARLVTSHRCQVKVTATASGGTGFGKSNRKAPVQKVAPYEAPKFKDFMTSGTSSSQDTTVGQWFEIFDMNQFPVDRQAKVIELANKRVLTLFKYKDKVYCTDAFSTAYQYPLIDGVITDGTKGPVIETPLDGTKYELLTGKVVEWCPQDSVVRNLLGALKKKVNPVDLPVHRTVIKEDGKVMVQLTPRPDGV